MKFSLKSMSPAFVRQTAFSGLAIFMLVILLFVIIYSTSYIVRNSESALDVSVQAAPQQRFDIQGYEKLQLIKQKKVQ